MRRIKTQLLHLVGLISLLQSMMLGTTNIKNLVGCLYYLYQWCTVKQISDNEIYLSIKYIKSVLWGVAKHLSYIEDARCLKVKPNHESQATLFDFFTRRYKQQISPKRR